MTLERDGWIDERPYAAIYDDDGPMAFHCLTCGTETVPDATAFAAHRCHKARKLKEKTDD